MASSGKSDHSSHLPGEPSEGPLVEPEKDARGVVHPVDGHGQDGDATVEDWRDLARRIQNETDSNAMIEMIQQLIAKLDAAQLRKKGRDEK